MNNYGNIINLENHQKVEEYLKNVIKAVKKACEVSAIAEYKCKKLNDAIDSDDKEKMWSVLQEYIHNYSELFSGIYGVVLVQVNKDFYNSVTEKDIIYYLDIVKGLIYFNEAMHCAVKETIRACLKNLLKGSDIFSDKEIEALLL